MEGHRRLSSSTSESPKPKITGLQIVLGILAIAVIGVMAAVSNYNATHHSVTLRISGEAAVVKIKYGYSLPSPSRNQVSRQTNEAAVSVPWETKLDIEGLEPTVTLTVDREPGDNRPLSCAVIIGDENNNKAMAVGETTITCQGTIRRPEPVGVTPRPTTAPSK